MQLKKITKADFLQLVYNQTNDFMAQIEAPTVFIVQQFYPKSAILQFRQKVYEAGLQTDPSWHPLFDDCPDYHRLHDNYPKAWVKSKMHATYYHGWYEHNRDVFDFFKEVFEVKNFLAGMEKSAHIHNIPSEGAIARVNLHHYPRGGGYQTEHIDPMTKFAKIQTIIQASQYGVDFKEGGVYGKASATSEPFMIDPHTEPGDLIVMSPGIHHGVLPVDSSEDYDWQKNEGRWMVMPIILYSDYPHAKNVKPKEVEK